MLDRIEALHDIGYLHMDIKTENILIGSNDYKTVLSSTLKMIDFGLTLSYLDSDCNHVKKSRSNDFRGNILFASKYALQYKT